jgi:hypothetical protein
MAIKHHIPGGKGRFGHLTPPPKNVRWRRTYTASLTAGLTSLSTPMRVACLVEALLL